MQSITVRDRQTLLDLAMQCEGSVEDVFDLAAGNNISISDLLTTGAKIITTVVKNKNEQTAEYFNINKLYPASDDREIDSIGGIEYDSIEEPEPFTQPYL